MGEATGSGGCEDVVLGGEESGELVADWTTIFGTELAGVARFSSSSEP